MTALFAQCFASPSCMLHRQAERNGHDLGWVIRRKRAKPRAEEKISCKDKVQ